MINVLVLVIVLVLLGLGLGSGHGHSHDHGQLAIVQKKVGVKEFNYEHPSLILNTPSKKTSPWKVLHSMEKLEHFFIPDHLAPILLWSKVRPRNLLELFCTLPVSYLVLS